MEDNIFDKVHEVDLKKTMETSYIDLMDFIKNIIFHCLSPLNYESFYWIVQETPGLRPVNTIYPDF